MTDAHDAGGTGGGVGSSVSGGGGEPGEHEDVRRGEATGSDAGTPGAIETQRGTSGLRPDEPDSRRDVPTRIPDGETPGARCPHCERPFRTERLRDLHVGEIHEESSSDEEREAHDDADEAELDELFFYHIKVVVLIGLLFSVFVLGYTVVLSGGV